MNVRSVEPPLERGKTRRLSASGLVCVMIYPKALLRSMLGVFVAYQNRWVRPVQSVSNVKQFGLSRSALSRVQISPDEISPGPHTPLMRAPVYYIDTISREDPRKSRRNVCRSVAVSENAALALWSLYVCDIWDIPRRSNSSMYDTNSEMIDTGRWPQEECVPKISREPCHERVWGGRG